MNVVKNVSIKKPVIYLNILKDKKLLSIDSDTTVRTFLTKNLSLESGFKVNIKHERYKTQVVVFSEEGDYFATLSANCRESRLYNAKTKKIIARINRHQGEVSCVGIDPLTRFMFSCGDDGKTFATDIKSGKLIFTLPPHADTINDIAFSPKGTWVATAGYDRKISLFSLVTMTHKEKFKAHSAPIVKMRFLSKNRLLSVDKNAKAIVWNIHTGKVIMRLEGIHDDIVSITTSKDDQFLFLGTVLGYVLLYDLNTYKQLSNKYIKMESPLTYLDFDEENEYLIIGTVDGFIAYYDIYEGQDQLMELLKMKKFQEIEKSSLANPILAYTNIYDMVSNLWENTLKKAKILLQNGESKKALLLFGHFTSIPSRNRVIQKIIKDYDQYDKFVQFAKEHKLALAYSLANSFPVYKESKIFQALEKQWKKSFVTAQKLSLSSKGMDKAKELLAPYRGISDKTLLIQDMMTKGEIYKRFLSYFGKRDFKMCSELLKQYQFLKEFPEYETLSSYADNVYMKLQESVKKGDTYTASKFLKILSDFDDFKDEISELSSSIAAKQKFFDAVANNNLSTAYELLDANEELFETEDGIKLNKQWLEDIGVANSYALSGDVQGVKDTLSIYLNIPSKYHALSNEFAWCYSTQIEQKIAEKAPQKEIEKGIKNYVLSFGLQDQIVVLFERFQKAYPESKLNIELLSEGSSSMWRPSMIVPSILD